MKKINFFLLVLASVTLFVGCSRQLDTPAVSGIELKADTKSRKLLSAISLASELDTITLNATNGIATTGGYYWNQTYTNTNFQTTNFKFSHTANVSWNYWDGFTLSNVADTTNYGTPGHSEGWLPHQWGSMAVPTGAESKPNFLVGYWGYYLDDQNPIDTATVFGENKYSNWVKLGNDMLTYTVSKVTMAIHPWPYYGILYGDGFARKFVSGDYFDLIVYGVKADGKFVKTSSGDVKSIEYKMADYTGSSLIMPTGWKDITIDFGTPVKYLVFQMFSSDYHPIYGPNTAVYFNLRDIVMQ
ncbi:MAG: DUF4465 domain-containing protein [Niabella sp.]